MKYDSNYLRLYAVTDRTWLGEKTLATQALEKLKREKKLSGQVTKEKIENWIILNKKEYADLLEEKRELEITVELFKSLSSQYESKKSLLQTQGRLYEKKRFIIEKGGNTDEW